MILEFKAFSESQRHRLLKLQESQANERKLQEKITSLESVIKRLEAHNKHLK